MTDDLDKSQKWRDGKGQLWEWSDHNGWVVDGMATLGGCWPDDEYGPFTAADTKHEIGSVDCGCAWHPSCVGVSVLKQGEP